MPGNDIFTVNNIVKRYSSQLALDNVTISIPEGSVYGLLGPNGAGKTTLLRIINQITAPDEGALFFKGRKFVSDDIVHIGYLPEERGLYKKMKVGEQALYLARLKGLNKNDALVKLKYWFEKFGIQAWWNKKVEELSKGMQQKVQFIVTILHQPALLIFDEPFSGFDPINTNLLKNEILNLKKQGATILLSTHDMGSVEELCDNITLINKAKTILEGEVHDIRMRYKANLFEIGFRGDPEDVMSLINKDFELTSRTETRNGHLIRIKAKKELPGNIILQHFLPLTEIISFNEVIPSMNEVFINVVESQKN
ncbi:MAG: ATP-binding cassette domain-containing protein [Bacteroidales bacterium]|nr:ATP-binding cassette domain-containing protein [Bacteroidales bacterium]MBN2762685.1 ATP-binding cassette domain-containing protein [Bacteroidales bacterium]